MKQILVVDDSSTMRRMVMASLQNLQDVKFDQASNGLEAVEQLAMKVFDLMILDLNMPEMHGMDVLKFVREHNNFKQIPIIVLSTKGDNFTQITAITAGASHYMTKPFEPQILAEQVKALLE